MKTSEFRLMIQTLYGAGAQSKLARELGISTRTVRRWASSERPIPPWVKLILTQQLKDLEESNATR